jgi:methylphosphotriester-DNA--protein-cysteine methyltransferase
MFRRKGAFLALMLLAAFLLAALALAADYKYVALKRGGKYHYPHCEYARTMDARLLFTFNSVKEARAAGYKPCGVCKPPRTD